MDEERPAAQRVRLDLERPVVVAIEPRRARSAGADIAIRDVLSRRGEHILDAGAHLVEDAALAFEVVGEREPVVDVGRADFARRRVAMPRLQIGQAVAGVDGRAHDDGGDDEDGRCGEPRRPPEQTPAERLVRSAVASHARSISGRFAVA